MTLPRESGALVATGIAYRLSGLSPLPPRYAMPVPQSTANAATASPFSDPFTGSATLNTTPNAPFVYLASSESGSVRLSGLDQPTWLPELAMFRLEPGVQGVEVIKEGQPRATAWAMALDARRREGWVVLDPSAVISAEHLPPGVDPGPYWRAESCYHLRSGVGGQFYREAWSVRLPSRRESSPPRWSFDKARFNRWLYWMVSEGNIPGPDDMTRDEVIHQLESWSASQSRIVDSALRSQQSTVTESRLELHRSALVIDPDAEPAPTKRKRA